MFSKFSRALKNRKGFTLVELMVVLVIIGILVAIAVPVYNNAQATAQQRACQANLRILDSAAAQYMANNGSYPASLDALAPNYVQRIPSCPGGGTYNYTQATGRTTCSIANHNY
ncbi:MAG: prepilin-type N-terminal cleavage/methylation domain-containing protein [Bacillota bacterium]